MPDRNDTKPYEDAIAEYIGDTSVSGLAGHYYSAITHLGWLIERLLIRGWKVGSLEFDALANRYWAELTTPEGDSWYKSGITPGDAVVNAAGAALLAGKQ